MKGLELPINVLVVVAVAVIVLLGVVGLFFAGFIGGGGTIALTAARNNACAELISRGCGTTLTENVDVNYDTDSDGLIEPGVDTLASMCINQFGKFTGTGANKIVDESACKRDICACPGL